MPKVDPSKKVPAIEAPVVASKRAFSFAMFKIRSTKSKRKENTRSPAGDERSHGKDRHLVHLIDTQATDDTSQLSHKTRDSFDDLPQSKAQDRVNAMVGPTHTGGVLRRRKNATKAGAINSNIDCRSELARTTPARPLEEATSNSTRATEPIQINGCVVSPIPDTVMDKASANDACSVHSESTKSEYSLLTSDYGDESSDGSDSDGNQSTSLRFAFVDRNDAIAQLTRNKSALYSDMIWSAEMQVRRKSRRKHCRKFASRQRNQTRAKNMDDLLDSQEKLPSDEEGQAKQRPWQMLSLDEKAAARMLGFNKEEWNRSQARVSTFANLQRYLLFEVYHGMPAMGLIAVYCFGNLAIYELTNYTFEFCQQQFVNFFFSDDSTIAASVFSTIMGIISLLVMRYTGYAWYWCIGLDKGHYKAAKFEMHNRLGMGWWDARLFKYLKARKNLFGFLSIVSFYVAYISASFFFNGPFYDAFDAYITRMVYFPIAEKARRLSYLPEEPPHFAVKEATCRAIAENINGYIQQQFGIYWCNWTPACVAVSFAYSVLMVVVCGVLLKRWYGYNILQSVI